MLWIVDLVVILGFVAALLRLAAAGVLSPGAAAGGLVVAVTLLALARASARSLVGGIGYCSRP